MTHILFGVAGFFLVIVMIMCLIVICEWVGGKIAIRYRRRFASPLDVLRDGD